MDVLKGFFQKHGWRYLPGMAFLILNAGLLLLRVRYPVLAALVTCGLLLLQKSRRPTPANGSSV